MLIKQTYRNCLITRMWTGNTQPNTFEWVHDSYDGPPSNLCGYGRTIEEVKADIDEILDERGTD